MRGKLKWTRSAFQVLRGKQESENRPCRGQLEMWKVPPWRLSPPLESSPGTSPAQGRVCGGSWAGCLRVPHVLWGRGLCCWSPHWPRALCAALGTPHNLSFLNSSGNKSGLLHIRLEHWNWMQRKTLSSSKQNLRNILEHKILDSDLEQTHPYSLIFL